GDLTAARHVAKRLRARVAGVPVIVGRLGRSGAPARSRQLLRMAGVRDVGFSLEKLKEVLRPCIREAARVDEARAEAEQGAALDADESLEAELPPDVDPELSPAR